MVLNILIYFVKDKSQSSQRNVSELIAKIESLEYDIVMLTDNLTAVQRNYDKDRKSVV